MRVREERRGEWRGEGVRGTSMEERKERIQEEKMLSFLLLGEVLKEGVKVFLSIDFALRFSSLFLQLYIYFYICILIRRTKGNTYVHICM